VGEWGQQHWFHSLWLADQRINQSLAGALDRRAMIALAMTAGIGEEITMRGALQPKLGLVRTSLFFAALHVQYSWYGMTLIFLLGIVLGLIRKRSNTAVAMTVHAIYDLVALLAT
jgi:membrane protease YdiL (CAAX protease family)